MWSLLQGVVNLPCTKLRHRTCPSNPRNTNITQKQLSYRPARANPATVVTPRLGLVGMDQHKGQSPPKIALFSGKLVGCLHFHLLQAGREQLRALVKPGSAVSSRLLASRAWANTFRGGGKQEQDRKSNPHS